MGGQACVWYGGAEFSRDCDVVILADVENLTRLKAALAELEAQCIAVPPFEREYLDRGHAIHFRCQHVEARGMRLDVMSKLRGCDLFASLWKRRTTINHADGTQFELLDIADLIQAKKTQRDKDWPMITRLVEAHHEQFREEATEAHAMFWLRESRTPTMLISVAADWPEQLREVLPQRPLLAETLSASATSLGQELKQEEALEKAKDQNYWRPLKRELEELRRRKRKER
jgi:hypothetical protein